VSRPRQPQSAGPVRVALAEVLTLGAHKSEALAVLDEAGAPFEANGNVAAMARIESLRSSL